MVSVCTSVIVQCKLMFVRLKRPSLWLQAAYDLEIARLQVEPLTKTVPPVYARLCAQFEAEGTPTGANDALIAAHAMALKASPKSMACMAPCISSYWTTCATPSQEKSS